MKVTDNKVLRGSVSFIMKDIFWIVTVLGGKNMIISSNYLSLGKP